MDSLSFIGSLNDTLAHSLINTTYRENTLSSSGVAKSAMKSQPTRNVRCRAVTSSDKKTIEPANTG
jgi:hypothetical protein